MRLPLRSSPTTVLSRYSDRHLRRLPGMVDHVSETAATYDAGSAPFDLAEDYRAAGWQGVLALPSRDKVLTIPGVTGYNGRWPTPKDWENWRHQGLENIALRLPPVVIGIDVDAYAPKRGRESVATLEKQHGALPATWWSTSRDDGVSGIRFYRVPAEIDGWPTQAGADIEIIRHAHRYAVVAPSIHPEGRTYRWRRPDGEWTEDIPRLGDFPELPARWLEGLTGYTVNGKKVAERPGSMAAKREHQKAARAWLRELPDGEPCEYVAKLAADAKVAAGRGEGGAHDNTLGPVLALLRAGETGHPGVPGVIDRVRDIFVETVKDRAPKKEAGAEFDRLVDGGVAKVLAEPGERAGQGCDCVKYGQGTINEKWLNGGRPTSCSPGQEVSPAPLRWTTARELAASTPEEPEWLARGIVARGVLTELSAKIKVGKTTFYGHLVRAMLNSEPFLGRETKSAPVVLLTEERQSTIRDWLHRVGLEDEGRLHILHRYDTRSLTWPDIVDQAVAYARTVDAGLLIVDTLPDWAGVRGDSENDAGAALEAMAPLQDAAASNLAVLAVRHDRKGGGEIGDSARGSSAYGGAVDIILGLRRADSKEHENRRVLLGVGRFDDIPSELTIELQNDRYVSLGSGVDVERQKAKEKILDALPENGEGLMSEGEVVEKVDMPRTTVRRALEDLTGSGKITRHNTGAGSSGRAAGYALTRVSTLGSDPGQSSKDYVSQRDVQGISSGERSDPSPVLSTPKPLGGQSAPVQEYPCQCPGCRECEDGDNEWHNRAGVFRPDGLCWTCETPSGAVR